MLLLLLKDNSVVVMVAQWDMLWVVVLIVVTTVVAGVVMAPEAIKVLVVVRDVQEGKGIIKSISDDVDKGDEFVAYIVAAVGAIKVHFC